MHPVRLRYITRSEAAQWKSNPSAVRDVLLCHSQYTYREENRIINLMSNAWTFSVLFPTYVGLLQSQAHRPPAMITTTQNHNMNGTGYWNVHTITVIIPVILNALLYLFVFVYTFNIISFHLLWDKPGCVSAAVHTCVCFNMEKILILSNTCSAHKTNKPVIKKKLS